jgi:cysteinyl-tRNA synthetase
MLTVLGLESVFAGGSDRDDAIDEESLALLAERERARARRDFETADAVREQLRARGLEIRDGPDGPRLIAIDER